MFRAYGTAPPETPSAGDLYPWSTTQYFNKGSIAICHFYKLTSMVSSLLHVWFLFSLHLYSFLLSFQTILFSVSFRFVNNDDSTRVI